MTISAAEIPGLPIEHTTLVAAQTQSLQQDSFKIKTMRAGARESQDF